MFRVTQHQSSGALKTVTAASGTGHNIGPAYLFYSNPVIITCKHCVGFQECSQHYS